MFGILDNLRRDTRSVRILLSVTLGAALLSLAFSPVVWAQTEGSLPPVEDEDLTDENSTSNVPELLFVLDLSGSMEYWVSDGQKLGLAVAAIDDAYSALVEQGTHVEVLGYSGECTGWPPQSLVDMPQINEIDWGVESASLEASGATPTDLALVAALHRMGIVDSLLNPTGRDSGTIVLISDGESNQNCVDPCAVAQEYGAGRVTVHSIGFDLAAEGNAVDELTCIARVTGGVSVSVDDYEELQAEVAKLARLRTSVDFRRVEVQGASLDVEIALTNNVALDDAYLRIVGPSSLLASSQVDHGLGRLEAGDSRTLTFLWNATPCDSLSTIVEFIVGGFREDDETAVGDVSEALAAIVTVEDILLKAMTQRELDGRCGDSVSSSRRNLLSADGGDSSDDSEPSRALAYGGAGVASLLAGLAAWRRKSSAGLAPRRRKSSAESKLEGASEAVSRTSKGTESITKSKRLTAHAAGGEAGKFRTVARGTVRAAEWGDDKLKLSYSIKKVPVVGGGVALLTWAINDPTVGCVTCGAAVVGAATGAGAVAGAVSIGAFAVPAAFVAGEGMQWLWDNHLANLPPIAWTIDGISTAWSYTGGPVVDYAGDGLKKVGGWIGDKVR